MKIIKLLLILFANVTFGFKSNINTNPRYYVLLHGKQITPNNDASMDEYRKVCLHPW